MDSLSEFVARIGQQIRMDLFLSLAGHATLRGTIHSYNTSSYNGIIILEHGSFQVTFRDLRSAAGVRLFHPGDLVEFQIKKRQAVNISIYRPVDAFRDVYWCSTCRRYLRYLETEERIVDGDWGESLELHCKTCSKQVRWAETFTTANALYQLGKLTEQETAEFEEALEDRSKMSDFLTRKYPK